VAGEGNELAPDWPALSQLEGDLVRTLEERGVVRVEYVVAFAPPFDLSIWLGTTTDEQRDSLAGEAAIDILVRELGRKHGLLERIGYISIESVETVIRDYDGSWFHRLR